MNPSELAQLLFESSHEQRLVLISKSAVPSAIEVAAELQKKCYEVWTDDPGRVAEVSDCMVVLANHATDRRIEAYSSWTKGIAELVAGNLEKCIAFLETSESQFLHANDYHLAAKTQTSKLYALALLGRYDEAAECGKEALKVFVVNNDFYSAGKVEHNIANLFWRRDLYQESEPYLRSAHERFEQIDDQRQLAMVENCQAFVKTLQNDFRAAEPLYQQALSRAESNRLSVTAAEIETGLSNLNLFKGNYELALKFMESSRQKYERLDMPIQLTICQLEIAEIYLEINLLPEAIGFYRDAERSLSTLNLQAELARCSLGYARALQRQGNLDAASIKLEIAERLYENEGNAVSIGSVRLARSENLLRQGDLDGAEVQVELALSSFVAGRSFRLGAFATWLRSEIWIGRGRVHDAVAQLKDLLETSRELSDEIYYLTCISLGKITGEEQIFHNAVDVVEGARIKFASEELRTSYFAGKVSPYNELIKKSFARNDCEAALLWHERSRFRSMIDSSSESSLVRSDETLLAIREHLNALHRRTKEVGTSPDGEKRRISRLRYESELLEKEYAERLRRLHARGGGATAGTAEFDLAGLREKLGDATIVEFAAIDDKLSVFIISRDHFTAIPDFANLPAIEAEVGKYLFQLKTGRLIAQLSDAYRKAANDRLMAHSHRLYDVLIRPLEQFFEGRQVVFAPAGSLNALPMHALNDREKYLIERFSVSYVPSLRVLSGSLSRAETKRSRAVIGHAADAAMPLAVDEVNLVAENFDSPKLLFGPDLTLENLRREVPDCGVLHLACHGRFRRDNPGFSSLDLFGEKLTANEIQTLPLKNCIVVLSSCEGGMNEVVAGEELIGLTRSFFAADVSTLVQGLWRISDLTAPHIMGSFYREFCGGMRPADALRKAQISLIDLGHHPYFWAPFVIQGRW